jgi:transcriptional regulator with XRE-family HTH domain
MAKNHFIREWRKHRNLSLRRLADRLNDPADPEPFISDASLSRIERGLQPYSQPILEALKVALRCSIPELLEVNPLVGDGDEIEAWRILREMTPDKKAQARRLLKAIADEEAA